MSSTFLLGVDDSSRTWEAVEQVGGLFLKSRTHFHLLHALPESTLPASPPTSIESSDWEKIQQQRAQRVLERAVGSLLQMGYKRSRLAVESKLHSINTVQDILDSGKKIGVSAIVLARKQRSKMKRLLEDTTIPKLYQDAESLPVWAIGNMALEPPHILAAMDESKYADRIAEHLAYTVGAVRQVRITLLNIIPAKPPAYWDDGHILDKSERGERKTVVRQWRWNYEEIIGGVFARARGVLTRAGVAEERITTRLQTRVRGIARDILVEASRGGYNILALGRRGAGMSQYNLGSRASKILRSAPGCTLILVN